MTYICALCDGQPEVPDTHIHNGFEPFGQIRWDFETEEIIS